MGRGEKRKNRHALCFSAKHRGRIVSEAEGVVDKRAAKERQ